MSSWGGRRRRRHTADSALTRSPAVDINDMGVDELRTLVRELLANQAEMSRNQQTVVRRLLRVEATLYPQQSNGKSHLPTNGHSTGLKVFGDE